MKKIALIVILALTVAGCHHRGRLQSGEVGSGVRKTERRDLAPFTSISTEGAFDIEVVCQRAQSLDIEGDDNLLPLVSTEVANGVLRIKPIRDYSTRIGINITISVASIDGLKTNGAGTIKVTDLKNDKFEIGSNGAPTITVSGETKALQIDTNGAGKIDTHRLRAAKADVESKGVTRVEVFASDELNVTISGPSQVVYDGDPEVNQTVNGPGSVRKREGSGS